MIWPSGKQWTVCGAVRLVFAHDLVRLDHLVHLRLAGLARVDHVDAARAQTRHDQIAPRLCSGRRGNCCTRSSRSDATRRRRWASSTRWTTLRVGRRVGIDVDRGQVVGLVGVDAHAQRRDEHLLLARRQHRFLRRGVGATLRLSIRRRGQAPRRSIFDEKLNSRKQRRPLSWPRIRVVSWKVTPLGIDRCALSAGPRLFQETSPQLYLLAAGRRGQCLVPKRKTSKIARDCQCPFFPGAVELTTRHARHEMLQDGQQDSFSDRLFSRPATPPCGMPSALQSRPMPCCW